MIFHTEWSSCLRPRMRSTGSLHFRDIFCGKIEISACPVLMTELIPGLPDDIVPLIATTPWLVSVLFQCSRGLRGFLTGWCVRASSEVDRDENIFVCVYSMHGYEWVFEYIRGLFLAITPARAWDNNDTNPHTCVVVGGGYFSGTLRDLRGVILDFFGPRRIASVLVHIQAKSVEKKPIIPRICGVVSHTQNPGVRTVIFDKKPYMVTLSANGNEMIIISSSRNVCHIPCAHTTTESQRDLYMVEGRMYILGGHIISIIASAYPVYPIRPFT